MNILTAPQTQVENAVMIMVTEAIGDNLSISCVDGQKVYDQIAAAFHAGKNAIVSFKDAEDVTSAFLVIGHLYAEFPDFSGTVEQIESSLRVVDMEEIDADDLKYTIEEVKDYLKDPERWKAAARETFGKYYDE
ncbi:MAG: STAS-like domain-containing protein [Hormoscilla sp. GM102CHS1]|nr:STAS-like domain-containing protein [Hormoscilla sp. GM102CHS1]